MWLSVADVAALTRWHPKRVQRALARWRDQGGPTVRYEQGVQGNRRGRLVVSAPELRALLAGDLQAAPLAEAA